MDDSFLSTRCSHCQKRVRVPKGTQRFKCPRCSLSSEVPAGENSEALGGTNSPVDPQISPPTTPIPTEIPDAATAPAPMLQRRWRGSKEIGIGLIGSAVFSLGRPLIGLPGIMACVGASAVALLILLLLLRMIHRFLSSHLGSEHPSTVSARERVGCLLRYGLTAIALAAVVVGLESVGPDEGLLPTVIDNVYRVVEVRLHRIEKPPTPVAPIPLERAIATLEAKPWAEADFVMVNPSHVAVAVKQLGRNDIPLYRVAAKVDGPLAEQAAALAWDLRKPIVANDPALTRKVFATVPVGEKIGESLASQVLPFRQPRSLLPAASRLVVFHDLRSSKRRVGHLLKQNDTGFEFCDLVPTSNVQGLSRDGAAAADRAEFRSEFVAQDLIQPGTFRSDPGEYDLRAAVDFLDLCLYQVLKTLQSQPEGHIHVVVDQVVPDIGIGLELLGRQQQQVANQASALRTQHDQGRTGLQQGDAITYEQYMNTLTSQALQLNGPESWWDAIMGALKGVNSERDALRGELRTLRETLQSERGTRLKSFEERERLIEARLTALEDAANWLAEQMQKLNELRDQLNRLASEIRGRLSRAGVPLLDRSEHAAKVAKSLGTDSWNPPPGAVAAANGLIGASHLLLTSIRKPDRRGRYQLSMRLVDVRTGAILWEDQADRYDTSEQALEMASTAYLLNTGRVTLLDFGEGIRPDPPRALDELTGGLPIHLPSVRLSAVATEAPRQESEFFRGRSAPKQQNRRGLSPPRTGDPARGVHTRLGYVEVPGPLGKGVLFRDLFSTSTQPLDSFPLGVENGKASTLAVDRIKQTEVSSLAELPDAHLMRYVVWRLAHSILPLAGRVVRVEGNVVATTLGRGHGVRPGDHLTLLRTSPLGREANVLPTELILREVHDSNAMAIVARASPRPVRPGPPDSTLPQPGDLVHRALTRPIAVAVLEPSIDLEGVPAGALAGITRDDLRILMRKYAVELASQVQGAFVQLHVPVVERENMNKILGELRLKDIDVQKTVESGRLAGATHIIIGTVAPDLNREYRPPTSLSVVDVETGQVLEKLVYPGIANWQP